MLSLSVLRVVCAGAPNAYASIPGALCTSQKHLWCRGDLPLHFPLLNCKNWPSFPYSTTLCVVFSSLKLLSLSSVWREKERELVMAPSREGLRVREGELYVPCLLALPAACSCVKQKLTPCRIPKVWVSPSLTCSSDCGQTV